MEAKDSFPTCATNYVPLTGVLKWRKLDNRASSKPMMTQQWKNFATCKHTTALKVQRASKTRIWLRVTCTSNLVDISRRRIPWERLNGEW